MQIPVRMPYVSFPSSHERRAGGVARAQTFVRRLERHGQSALSLLCTLSASSDHLPRHIRRFRNWSFHLVGVAAVGRALLRGRASALHLHPRAACAPSF